MSTEVIDAHCHAGLGDGFRGPWDTEAKLDRYLARAQRAAISRTVVTRSDSGRATFNISEVAGSGASSGISSFYYPSRERSFGNVAKEWGIDIGIDSASFVAKEFWPDVNRRLFRHRETTSGSAH